MFMERMKLTPFLRMVLAIMSLMILPLIGCGGGGGGGGSSSGGGQVQPQPPAPQPTADITVSITQIAFGDVVVGQFSDQTISVGNNGSVNLNIGQIAKVSSSSPFTILNDNCSGNSIVPTGTCTFQIRFSPSSQNAFNDVFNIPSNDPDAAENPVVLNVSGTGRMLNVSINQIYTNSCPRVRLLINVNDKDGYPLTGLTGNHLTLLENAAPRTIEAFSPLVEPISVALVLDYSGSMYTLNMVPAMEAAAKLFIDRLNPNDEASIIKYSENYSIMQDFTTDKDALKAAIDSPFTGHETTLLYDTLWVVIDETAVRPNKQAIVVISDGQDNTSTHTLTEVVAKAKGSGIPVFAIGFGDVNVLVLPPLANETGGRYFFAPTADDLNLIYLQIVDILVGQYALEYTSQVHGSITLDLAVNFNGMTGMATRSFTGCP